MCAISIFVSERTREGDRNRCAAHTSTTMGGLMLSLRQVKIVYYAAVVLIAVLLALAGGALHWIAAAGLLVGAVPMFNAVSGAMKAATLHDVELQARIIADQTGPLQQPAPHQDQHSQLV